MTSQGAGLILNYTKMQHLIPFSFIEGISHSTFLFVWDEHLQNSDKTLAAEQRKHLLGPLNIKATTKCETERCETGGFTLPPPGQPSAAADTADADAPVGADDVGHRVPAGARAPVGEVHRAGSHVRWELLERREERASEGGGLRTIKCCFFFFPPGYKKKKTCAHTLGGG